MKISKKIVITFTLLVIVLFVYGGCHKGKKGSQQVQDLTSAELDEARRIAINQTNIEERDLIGQPINIAPRIFITEPDGGDVITTKKFNVEWVASDRNNDVLLIILEYQREGSNNFITIADFQENDGDFLVDFTTVTPGKFRIRATATDGELEGSDTTGTFEVKTVIPQQNGGGGGGGNGGPGPPDSPDSPGPSGPGADQADV